MENKLAGLDLTAQGMRPFPGSHPGLLFSYGFLELEDFPWHNHHFVKFQQ